MHRSRHFSVFLLSIFFLFPAVLAHAQETSPSQSAPIKVSVDRVNVGVVVTDGAGKFVAGLNRDDFQLFDNGVEQPLTGFATIEEPAQVLLLIEAGPAVYLLEGGHLRAAYALLTGLAPSDRVAVVKYADASHPLVDFTSDKQVAAASFDELRFNLGFGSLNLSSSLSQVLDWLASVPGKKTVVLLSTGVDTSSANSLATLLQRLETSDVRLLAVSLTGELRYPPPNRKKKSALDQTSPTAQQFAEADLLLKRLAESTGGRAFFPTNTKEFTAMYSEIAQLVRHEYSLAFAPPARDGAVHSIEVRVTTPPVAHSTPHSMPNRTIDRSTYRIDHRRAYLAPASATS
ncbi:MAG TPA: VWA domain-containing protein [Candidatus Dormibacteraeota bacterium]|nr:VWA domain-containing protein [Candidatus Dormibacteraeota bacterium]